MKSEMGFPSSHQLKSYVAYKCRLKLAARAVLSADAGLLVSFHTRHLSSGFGALTTMLKFIMVIPKGIIGCQDTSFEPLGVKIALK